MEKLRKPGQGHGNGSTVLQGNAEAVRGKGYPCNSFVSFQCQIPIPCLRLGAVSLRLLAPISYPSPVFLPNVLVNLRENIGSIKRVLPVFSRARNPVVLASFYVIVVGLETIAVETSELLPPIVDRGKRLRVSYASNSCGAGETTGLALDIHDSRFVAHRF
jgi:hypothetical protein